MLNEALTRAALQGIDCGMALSADVENELEDRGYIVQTHKPYATITAKGRGLLDRKPLRAVASRTAHPFRQTRLT